MGLDATRGPNVPRALAPVLVVTLGPVFDAMLDFVAGAPRLPVQQYPRDFIRFVMRNNMPIPVWSALPDATVIDLLFSRRVL